MATCAHEAASEEPWDWQQARAVCLRVAMRYTANRADAEDVAQEAAIRAWRRRASLRDGHRRDDWLRRIARNEAMRLHDRRALDIVSEEPMRGSAPDPELQRMIEDSPVREAVAILSGPDRELLGLRYEEDLTQGAIADRLGVPEGTIKVRLHRARAKLRGALIDS